MTQPRKYHVKTLVIAMASAMTCLTLLPGLASAEETVSAQVQPQEATYNFNIAAKPLPRAIAELASVTNLQVLYTVSVPADVMTQPLQGRYTPSRALSQLLQGSGLTARYTGNNAVTIEQAASQAGESISLGVVRVEGHAERMALPQVYAGGQVAKGARLGVLGNTDVMNAPFNVTAYTAKTIEDQQSATIADVLRNDPSIRFTTSQGHNSENFTVRGFDLNSYDLAFNGMYNLLPATHVPTQFLERVEVFRGPSAMVAGVSPQGGVGGVINLVPKRATSEPITRLTGSYESDSHFGTGLDIGRRFGDDQQFGVRFNTYLADGETTLDNEEREEQLYSLGLDYQADNWRMELDLYHSKQNQDDGSPVMVGFTNSRGVRGVNQVLKASDPTDNLFKGTYVDQETNGFLFRGEYDLNDNWTTWAAVGASKHHYAGYINGTRVIVTDVNGDARAETYHQRGYRSGVSAETGIRGLFSTGFLDHEVAFSLSALQTREGRAPVNTSQAFMTNIYAPTEVNLADKPTGVDKSRDDTYTSYNLTDTMSALNERVLVTVGGRLQRIRQSMATPVAYDEDELTPLLGVVVKPWSDNVSFYGNYIEGLSPGATVSLTQNYTNAGEALAPYETKQGEVGVKWETGSFTNTVSLFRIEKPAYGRVAGTNLFGQTGDQVNRGVEWNVFGEVTPTIRVLGGAAYTRAKVSSQAANDGNDAYGVPRWTANLGGEWDTPWMRNLTLTSRVVYTGKQYLTGDNQLELPSWTVLDLGARYTTAVAGKTVVLRAGVDNVFNREYWAGVFNDGYTTLGGARTVRASATIDF